MGMVENLHLGVYTVDVRLAPEVVAKVKVWVVAK